MTTTDTGPQTSNGRALLRVLADPNPNIGGWSEIKAQGVILAIEAEAQRLTVERFDQQAAELVACELTLVDTVSGNAMHAIRTSDVRSFVDAIRAALAHPEEEQSDE